MATPTSTALEEAILTDQPAVFDPITGQSVDDLSAGQEHRLSPAARLGLEAPRFCQICGRRMVVQIRPDGWHARCSRHGELDSSLLETRR